MYIDINAQRKGAAFRTEPLRNCKAGPWLGQRFIETALGILHLHLLLSPSHSSYPSGFFVIFSFIFFLLFSQVKLIFAAAAAAFVTKNCVCWAEFIESKMHLPQKWSKQLN